MVYGKVSARSVVWLRGRVQIVLYQVRTSKQGGIENRKSIESQNKTRQPSKSAVPVGSTSVNPSPEPDDAIPAIVYCGDIERD